MAQVLIRRQIDAVVGMQFDISDRAAGTFTEDFTGDSLLGCLSTDRAATSALKALSEIHGMEWITPVLFMRSLDGRIYRKRRGQVMPSSARLGC